MAMIKDEQDAALKATNEEDKARHELNVTEMKQMLVDMVKQNNELL